MTTLPVPAEVSHVRVYLTNLSIVATDASDADTLPDWQPAVGSVTLAPLLSTGSVVTTSSGRGFVPLAKTFTLDATGSFEGWVLNSADADLSPSGWSYRVTVAITSPSATVIVGTFTPGAATTDANLLPLLPVSSSTGGSVVIPAGIPEGGTTGQALVKASDADFDVEWAPGGTGGVTSVDGQTGAVSLSSTYVPQTRTINGQSLTSDITISTGGSSTVTYDDAPAVPAEGESASYFVTAAVVWPSGLVWSTEPDNDTAPVLTTSALVYLFTLGGVTRAVLGATFPGGEIVFEDVTAPTVGTMAISDVTATSLTMTISGAADETALHTQPYAFTTDGTTYTAYQASNAYTPTGLTPETSYTCNWRVRDAAGNVSTGTAQSQTTSALAGLTVTAGGMTATRITNPTSPYTWSAAPVGTASATRRVVASVATYLNDIACNVTALTIGGVTATRNVFYRRDTRSTIELWSAEVPTGSTADVVITWDNAPQYANVSTQIIDGAASTVIDAGTGDASATVTPSAGGVVLAGMSAYSQSAAPVEWTGVTLLHQATSLPPVTATGGAQTSSTTDVTATPTFEWTPSNLAVAAIAVGLA